MLPAFSLTVCATVCLGFPRFATVCIHVRSLTTLNYVFEGILGVAKYLTQSLQGEDVGLKYALELINVVSDWEDLVQVDSKLVADFFDLFASYTVWLTSTLPSQRPQCC